MVLWANTCFGLKHHIGLALEKNHEAVFKFNTSFVLCSSFPFFCFSVLTNPSFAHLLECFEEHMTIERNVRFLTQPWSNQSLFFHLPLLFRGTTKVTNHFKCTFQATPLQSPFRKQAVLIVGLTKLSSPTLYSLSAFSAETWCIERCWYLCHNYWSGAESQTESKTALLNKDYSQVEKHCWPFDLYSKWERILKQPNNSN